jgi:hypothetical protein
MAELRKQECHMTTTQSTVAKIGPQNIQFVKGANFVSLYCNHIGISLNQFDLSIICGELMEVTTEQATVEQKGRITMSHLQAKLLQTVLAQQIQAFEERNGVIKMPENMSLARVQNSKK